MTTATKSRPRTLPTTFEGLVDELAPAAIHDDADHREAMEMIRELARVPKLSAGQLKYLETLGILVEAYEKKRYPRAKTPPLDMLKSFMEDHDMSGADLARLLDVTPSAVSLVLKGERGLSKENIKTLAAFFHVSTDLFL